MNLTRSRGFTLIEILITVALLGIIASIALPNYSAYIRQGRVPGALDALNSYYTRMEQRFQDTGNYGAGACGLAAPAGVKNFTVACALTGGGTGFTATATGNGTMAGYTYTINEQALRRTTAHPKGVPATNCWSMKGKTCDS